MKKNVENRATTANEKSTCYVIKKLAIAIAVIFFAAQGMAATVYVKDIGEALPYYEVGAASCDDVTIADTTGDLEAASVAASNPGTLYICAGTYTDTELDSDNAFAINSSRANTITAVGAVTLTSTTTTALIIYDTDNVSITGIIFDSCGSKGVEVNEGPSTLTFTNCVFSNNTKDGILFLADRNGKDIDTVSIVGGSAYSNGGEGVEVHFGIAGGDASGVFSFSLSDFDSYSNGGHGLYIHSSDQTNEKASDIDISDGKFYSNDLAGMYLRDIDNATAANVVSDCQVYENSTAGTLGGIWMGSVSYITIQGCEVYSNHTNGIDGRGIYPDGNCTNWNIISNLIYDHDDNTGATGFSTGIAVSDGTANNTGLIRNNVILDNYIGISVAGSNTTGILIYNNDIISSDKGGIYLRYTADQVDSSEVTIKNNIIADFASNANDYGVYDNDAVNDPVESNNLYFGLTDNDYQFTATNPITSNPRFLSISGEDFRLQGTSEAIDAGELLDIHIEGWEDRDGHTNIYGDGPDIGAFEYQKLSDFPIFRFDGGSNISDWYSAVSGSYVLLGADNVTFGSDKIYFGD